MVYPTITPLFLRTNGINQNTVDDTEKGEALLALYEQWIKEAIAVVDEFCQQPLIAASREIYFDSLQDANTFVSSNFEKLLPFTYTVSTTAVLSSRLLVSDSWTTVSTSYFRIAVRDKSRYLEFWNYSGGYRYKLAVTVGYTESTIPTPIQKIIIDMASWAWKESQIGKGTLGMNSQGVSGGVGSTTTSFANMPERFKIALAPYRVGTV